MSKRKQFELEFLFRSSPGILYNFLTTPSGLSQWFADSVDINDNIYSFYWSGSEEKAELIDSSDNEFVRYRWLDSPEDEYFEFRIEISEVTKDTILYIVDFAEEDEIEDQRLLWESQVENLHQHIGG